MGCSFLNFQSFAQTFWKVWQNTPKSFIVLKLKTDTIIIQRDTDILRKCFLTVHTSVIAKQFSQDFILYSMRQLIEKNNKNKLNIQIIEKYICA